MSRLYGILSGLTPYLQTANLQIPVYNPDTGQYDWILGGLQTLSDLVLGSPQSGIWTFKELNIGQTNFKEITSGIVRVKNGLYMDGLYGQGYNIGSSLQAYAIKPIQQGFSPTQGLGVVSVPGAHSVFDNLISFSIDCWVYLKGVPSSNFLQRYIVEKEYGGGGPQFCLQINEVGNTGLSTGGFLQFKVAGSEPPNYSTYNYPTGGIWSDTWHHVHAQWDGASAKQQVWWDGIPGPMVQCGSGHSHVSASHAQYPLFIMGGYNGAYSVNCGLCGRMDELLISTSLLAWDTSFEPSHYEHATTSTDIVLYHFNEESGVTVHDSSSHAFDGTCVAISYPYEVYQWTDPIVVPALSYIYQKMSNGAFQSISTPLNLSETSTETYPVSDQEIQVAKTATIVNLGEKTIKRADGFIQRGIDDFTLLACHCEPYIWPSPDPPTTWQDVCISDHNIAPYGGIFQDITTKKFGTASAKFIQSNNQYLLIEPNDLNFGTTDFSIEAQVYRKPVTSISVFPMATFFPSYGPCRGDISNRTVISVSGTGWSPGEDIDNTCVFSGISEPGDSSLLWVNGSGDIDGSIVPPSMAPGVHDITITGSISGAHTFTSAFEARDDTGTIFSCVNDPLVDGNWTLSLDDMGIGGVLELVFKVYHSGSFIPFGVPSGTPMNAGAWYHVAISRNVGDLMIFLNGHSYGGGGACNYSLTGEDFYIGKGIATTDNWDGWMDEIRVSRVARWYTDFTPPTDAYDVALAVPAIDGMVLKETVDLSNMRTTLDFPFGVIIPGLIPTPGSGYVVGPATNHALYVPQWNGYNTQALSDGIPVGIVADGLVQLDSSSKLPAIDGSQLINLPATALYSSEADGEILAGQLLFLKNTTHVGLAKADSVSTMMLAGLSIADCHSTFACKYIRRGKLSLTDWTSVVGIAKLTPGTRYFASPDIAGYLTPIATKIGGNVLVEIGEAIDSLTLDVGIGPVILL
jgi:hypothetical protein